MNGKMPTREAIVWQHLCVAPDTREGLVQSTGLTATQVENALRSLREKPEPVVVEAGRRGRLVVYAVRHGTSCPKDGRGGPRQRKEPANASQ